MEKKEDIFHHIPVLPKEVIEIIEPRKDGIYIDATLGGGGHAALIAECLGGNGKIIGIDQDIEAIQAAKDKLTQYQDKIFYVCDNFRNIDKILDDLKIKKVDGILIDLGVSTHQLFKTERGFSFSEKQENLDTLLDMRMNLSQEFTARDIINDYPEEDLKDIFTRLGEEKFAGKIAKKIVQTRQKSPIVTVKDLLDIIKSAISTRYRFKKGQGHYASRVFRAIRMEVNQELPVLVEVIPKAIDLLNLGGRLVIISFHSLEDRIIKQTFKEMASEKELVKLLTKKPITPTKEEIENNPKADSAKLRAIEKI